MNSKWVLALLFWAVSNIALSQAPNPKANAQIEALRKQWQEDRLRVLKPVDEAYVQELQKLMETQTRAGDLDSAIAVRAEIARVSGGRADVPKAPQGGANFTGRRWETGLGSKFFFSVNGDGYQETANGKDKNKIKWTNGPNDLITVEGEGPQNRKAFYYFRFTGPNEGVFGSSPANLDRKCSVK